MTLPNCPNYTHEEIGPECACRLQCAQAVARSYQGLQPHAEALGQLQVIHTFATGFDADTYVQTQRSVKQLRQDIMLLRQNSTLSCLHLKDWRSAWAL